MKKMIKIIIKFSIFGLALDILPAIIFKDLGFIGCWFISMMLLTPILLFCIIFDIIWGEADE